MVRKSLGVVRRHAQLSTPAAEPGSSASGAFDSMGCCRVAAELPSAVSSRCAGRQQGLAAELPAAVRCCQKLVTLLLPS